MNKNSNTYIITYASVMVVIVAAVLSFASLSLKNIQAENVRIEKMGDILRSIGEGGDADKAPNKAAYINEQYKKYIVDSYAVNVEGDKVEGADAFALLTNLKAEYDKPAAERELPVFVSKNDEGSVSYVIPVWGAGLWGPVWGMSRWRTTGTRSKVSYSTTRAKRRGWAPKFRLRSSRLSSKGNRFSRTVKSWRSVCRKAARNRAILMRWMPFRAVR